MLKEYLRNRQLQKDKRLQERHIEEEQTRELNKIVYARQKVCKHEFGDVRAYSEPLGTSYSRIGHFVVCKKCALRQEV